MFAQSIDDDPELYDKRTEVRSSHRGVISPANQRSCVNRCVRGQIVVKAAKQLDECQMIRFEETSGAFGVTDLGRVASHFYIQVS